MKWQCAIWTFAVRQSWKNAISYLQSNLLIWKKWSLLLLPTNFRKNKIGNIQIIILGIWNNCTTTSVTAAYLAISHSKYVFSRTYGKIGKFDNRKLSGRITTTATAKPYFATCRANQADVACEPIWCVIWFSQITSNEDWQPYSVFYALAKTAKSNLERDFFLHKTKVVRGMERTQYRLVMGTVDFLTCRFYC